ncbi:hypothetical protein [Streptomyces sp. NPDC086766]|uniref:hypothetical protein n=1 Tax=Streptomyces sp. NPDC086766 TaxID=3365754 RepID=UPI0037F3DD98
MADEENTESGPVPSRSRDLVVTTLVWEFVGLAACGLIALALWPFGWLPDSASFLAVPAMFAAGPVGELYRTRPPRRRAALAAFIATMTVTTFLGTAAQGAFPPLADDDLGLLAGSLVGAPAGAGCSPGSRTGASVA